MRSQWTLICNSKRGLGLLCDKALSTGCLQRNKASRCFKSFSVTSTLYNLSSALHSILASATKETPVWSFLDSLCLDLRQYPYGCVWLRYWNLKTGLAGAVGCGPASRAERSLNPPQPVPCGGLQWFSSGALWYIVHQWSAFLPLLCYCHISGNCTPVEHISSYVLVVGLLLVHSGSVWSTFLLLVSWSMVF
jgi:hypothetical protein